ncbi:heme ABC transporter permease [Thiomicrorhabdus indica]|uniref:heme ABC transporter permease n=1 Tax=Thiomicrorhabdus indica TaxID=2267253 RepID=UPI002AA6C95B|nr:heme ABC transporter permease [Thiomicrorhabdus indica]
MNTFLKWYYRLGAPNYFYPLAGKSAPWFATVFFLLLLPGLYMGLVTAPADYQQGDSFRIIYVHVPAAWMSMFVYAAMAVAAVIALVWRVRMAEIMIISSIPIGASFTLIALATGALWGKPMWGAWWVWDARLTSELILLFIYLGIFALYNAIEDKRTAGRAMSLLTLVGVVNLPIIHYSVIWWNTLHQAATVSKFDTPSIHVDMLIPLLIMAAAFQFLFLWVLMLKMRANLLEQDVSNGWVKKIIWQKQGKLEQK